MPMTYREFNRRLSKMQKVIEIRRDLKTLLPEIEQDKYFSMFSHLCYYHSDRKQYYSRNSRRKIKQLKPLTEAEKILLDYLIKNNLNPKTTYKWFLVSKLPEDIQTRLRNGQVSVVEARRISTNRLKQRQSNTGVEMIEEIRSVVSSL